MGDKRTHTQRKPAATTPSKPAATPPPDPRDAVISALQADKGPLTITISGNLVTRRVQIIDNSESEADLRVLMEWLESARNYLQGKLLAAAEARGRAAGAAAPTPPAA